MIMAAPNKNLGFDLLQQRRHLDECAGGGHALTSPVRQDGLPLAADQSSAFQSSGSTDPLLPEQRKDAQKLWQDARKRQRARQLRGK